MDSYSSDSSISYSRPAPQGLKNPVHSLHKTAPTSKAWKKPAGPNSSNKIRVYQVDRMNFRQLVQELTGAVPEHMARQSQFRKVGPPHLDLAHSHHMPKTSTMMSETLPDVTLGLGLSPTSLEWCSALTLSPTTLSSFGLGTML